MKIGTIKEIKDHENRVGLTPDNVSELVKAGHSVYIQVGAGLGAGFSDQEYYVAGAVLITTPVMVAETVDILVKIKEPVPSEYPLLAALNGKVIYTFLHLAANRELADELMKNNVTGISYDTIEDENGKLPLLRPMSEIAGILAAEMADEHATKNMGNVFVVGGGIAGTFATLEAVGRGAPSVCIYEPNPERVKQLEDMFYDYPVDVASCLKHVTKELYRSDVVIGSALVKGQQAPKVLTEEMVAQLKPGAFVVDISIDQGGCIFGSKPTSYSEPTYDFNGKTFCCIPNLPGQRPREATEALTKLSVPHLLEMANQGVENYLKANKNFSKGLNTFGGKVVNTVIAKELNLD